MSAEFDDLRGRLDALKAITNAQFSAVEARFDGIDKRLDGLAGALDVIVPAVLRMDERMAGIEDGLAEIRTTNTLLAQLYAAEQERSNKRDERMEALERRVRSLEDKRG